MPLRRTFENVSRNAPVSTSTGTGWLSDTGPVKNHDEFCPIAKYVKGPIEECPTCDTIIAVRADQAERCAVAVEAMHDSEFTEYGFGWVQQAAAAQVIRQTVNR